MEANQIHNMPCSSVSDSYNVLFDEWSHLLKYYRHELYFDLLLLKTALPDRHYIDLAIEMLFDFDLKINFHQKQFVMLVALSNFSTKVELVELIKKIDSQQLPYEWLPDFLFWQLLYAGEIESHKTTDRYLKSWDFACRALSKLSSSDLDYFEAERLCQQALARNEANAKAIAYSIYARTQRNPSRITLAEAAGIIAANNMMFGEQSVIAIYLNSLIGKYVYLPEYLENASMLDSIHSLGLDLDEPFIRKEQLKYIHLVQGNVNDRAAYFLVLLRPAARSTLATINLTETQDIGQLGKIIYSSFGEKPSSIILNRINRKYAVSGDEVNYARVVKEKIVADYQAALIAYEHKVSPSQVMCRELPIIDPSLLLSSKLVSTDDRRDTHAGFWQGEMVIITSYKNKIFSDNDLFVVNKELKEIHQLTHTNTYLTKLLAIYLSNNCLMTVIENNGHDTLKNILSSDITSISWSIRLKMAYQISCGLRYLHHNGFPHQNLKSANVILYPGYMPKLTGFGFFESIAQCKPIDLTIDQDLDAVRYKAPESIRQPEAINDQVSDIWSLGMLFFEISSRYAPFHDATTVDVAKNWIAQGMGESLPESCDIEQPKFAELMRSCWFEREKRLNIDEITHADCFTNVLHI